MTLMKAAPETRSPDGNFEQLIDLGREKGHLTYAEINKFLPDDVSSSDMETLLDELEELDIEVFDEKDMAAQAAKGADAANAAAEESVDKIDIERELDEMQEEQAALDEGGKIDDPVRLYL